MKITEAELLNALEIAARGTAPKDARTVRELAAHLGVGRDVITDRIRTLHDQGRVTVHVVQRPNVLGRLAPVPAYTILPRKGRIPPKRREK